MIPAFEEPTLDASVDLIIAANFAAAMHDTITNTSLEIPPDHPVVLNTADKYYAPIAVKYGVAEARPYFEWTIAHEVEMRGLD